MALRVMQIYVPQGAEPSPNELLKGREVLGRWRDEHQNQTVLHLLVPAEETEPIMDQFEASFSGVKGFHMVLFPVEAVLPRPQADPADGESEPPPADPARTTDQPAGNGLRISREELYAEVNENVGVTRVFLGLTVLSAVVAAFGLMRNDVAVIIGAMVIAPLLAPNVAMSLATTLGDTDLLKKALTTNFCGVTTAFLLALAIGLIFRVDADVPAIAARTHLGIGDILLALAAGAAGTLAFTSGLAGAVIGVMVAVALVPPLVVAGLLIGQGQFRPALDALLLTSTNVICVNLAGISTFLVQGVRPRTWWESEKAKTSTVRAMLIWTFLLLLLVLLIWFNNVQMEVEPSAQAWFRVAD